MSKSVLYSMVFILSVIAACGGSSSTGPSESGDWLPLSVGNQWVYDVTGYGISSVDADTATLTGTSTITIPEQTTHQQGFGVYVFQNISVITVVIGSVTTTTTDTTVTYMRNSGTELQSYDDTTTTDYDLIFILPLNIGDIWTPYVDTPTLTREVISLTEAITVTAGTFSACAYLKDTDPLMPGSYVYSWFAQGVGMLADELHIVEQGTVTHIEYELTGYNTN